MTRKRHLPQSVLFAASVLMLLAAFLCPLPGTRGTGVTGSGTNGNSLRDGLQTAGEGTESSDGSATDSTKRDVQIGAVGLAVFTDPESQQYLFLPSGISAETPAVKALSDKGVTILASANLPSVWIETGDEDAQAILANREHRAQGSVTILDEEGRLLWQLDLDLLKTRGNATFANYDKKQFLIKTARKVRLFGMGAGRKWILTSNVTDRSLLRNALSRKLASSLSLAQSDEGQFVDLYLNGEYQGNYYLCEKIGIGKERLDITDLEKETRKVNEEEPSSCEPVWTDTSRAEAIPQNPADITGGYLIEREIYDRLVLDAQTQGGYFITEGGDPYVLASPEYPSVEQLAYISTLVQNGETAAGTSTGYHPETGRYYLDYLDLTSFAAKYLLEEMTKNYDGGVSSSYFYKDVDRVDTRLHAGPAWDYDLAFGNQPYYLGTIDTSPLGLTQLAQNANGSHLWEQLLQHDDFQAEVKRLYHKIGQEAFREFVREGGTIDQLLSQLSASAAMDAVRWAAQYEETGQTRNQEEEAATVRDFILQRNEYLSEVW